MGELVPVLSGLSLGIFLARLRPPRQKYARIFAALLLGIITCSLNGELQASWAFLLLDTLLVAFATIAGYALAQGVRCSCNSG